VLALSLRPSRVLWAWWCLLHALLVAAAALLGWPAWIKVLAAVALVIHGFVRRPPRSPGLVLVAEGGVCSVPEWHRGPQPLGARTLMCPFWVRLDLGAGPWRRDLLLVADQVGSDEWRRLRALLARVPGD
jgi:hypothetical protein